MTDRDRRLRGIEEKHRRSQEHLAELQGIVNAHVDAHPITFLAEPQGHAPTTEYHVKVEAFEPPDYIALGVKIGEVLHLYRSILDSLAWHLSIENMGQDPPPKPKSIGFPITELKDLWQGNGLPRIASVAETPAAVIYRAQPFRARHAPNPEPLSLLAALNNMDKHRVIVPMAIVPKTFEKVGEVITSADDVMFQAEATGQPVEKDATVYVFRFSKPTNVQMEYHGSFAIAADLTGLTNTSLVTHYPFDTVLGDIAREVSRIATELWPYV